MSIVGSFPRGHWSVRAGQPCFPAGGNPDDFADLIAASPAVGFLSKADLSASTIRDLLDRKGDSDPGDRVSGPPGR